MTNPPPDDILSVPPRDFAPVGLCLDDVLPVGMVLVLGYARRLDPRALRDALESALRAFPHLGGQVFIQPYPLRAALVPGHRPVLLEWIRSGDPLPEPADPAAPLEALESLDQKTLAARYAPSAAAASRTAMEALQAPLLQLRLTWLPDDRGCVLGILVSHLALDGAGLALFLEHMTAALRVAPAPAVIHERRATFPDPLPEAGAAPEHYREIPQLSLSMADGDPLAATEAAIFSIPLASLGRKLGAVSPAEARFYLAAALSLEAAALRPALRTVALWCNARGLGTVPRGYTGNAGCYLHLPIVPGDAESLLRGLKRAVTRGGFAEIAAIYGRLKAAEAAGRFVFWNGPGESLLSLNLVPHARGVPDFGAGGPAYAQLLTRNVSGLRLYSTPDGERFVIEACLPPGHGDALMAACARLDLPARAWHRGIR